MPYLLRVMNRFYKQNASILQISIPLKIFLVASKLASKNKNKFIMINTIKGS